MKSIHKSVQQLMSLKGRVAMVTGGAGHLGFAMAEAMAQAGASVIILDVDGPAAQRKAKALGRTYKVKAFALGLDLADPIALDAAPRFIQKKMRRLDILVNCAALVGTSHLKGWAVPFAQQDIGTWRQAMEVNLTSVFALVQKCHPLLKKHGTGSIINIASIYGFLGPDMSLYKGTGMGNPAAYAAGKGGIIQLTRWLATTLAPQVRVNTISMGGVFRNHRNPFLSRYVAKTPLRRMAAEEDIVGAAVYLASDLSKYVTGHNLIVDGGLSAW